MEEYSAKLSAEDPGRYTSLSSLAVIALVLGVLSALAFTSTLLIVFPVAAVVTALIALISIRSSEGSLSGTFLAQAGLALGVLCAAASLARLEIRDYFFQAQADRVAQGWCELLSEGATMEALDWMSGSAKRRFTSGSSLGGKTPTYEPETAARLLGEDSLAVSLAELAGQGGVKIHREAAQCDWTGTNPRVAIDYWAESVGEDEHEGHVDFTIVLLRTRPLGPETRWLVDSWQVENEVAGAGNSHAAHAH